MLERTIVGAISKDYRRYPFACWTCARLASCADGIAVAADVINDTRAKVGSRSQPVPGSILERVLHQYGVVALGAGGQKRHRALDQLLDVAHILHRLRRQLAPLAGPSCRL